MALYERKPTGDTDYQPSESRRLPLKPYLEQFFTGNREGAPEPSMYSYLAEEELSPEMVELTRKAYSSDTAVNDYANLEWSRPSIEAVEEAIIRPLSNEISMLPDHSRVLVAGCGTMRDLALLALLRKNIEVVGFDLSEEMLLKGHKMMGVQVDRLGQPDQTPLALDNTVYEKGVNTEDILRWANILLVADVLSDAKMEGAWIVSFLNRLTEVARFGSSGSTNPEEVLDALLNIPEFQKVFLRGIQGRIAVASANIENRQELIGKLISSDKEKKKFKLILAVAVLPHVPKPEWFNSIDNLIELLEPEGVLQFNLRVDQSQFNAFGLEGRGKVFMDRVLGVPRYYETARQKADVFPLLAHLQSRGDVSYRLEPITPHPDPMKPGFLNFIVQKVASDDSQML
jgi:SAM-dependent methyltransferase